MSVNTNTFTITKKYKKYFAEIWDDVKKEFKQDFRIIMFLGGKNRGKSFTAFEMFYDEIKKGNKVVYMRNSRQELDNIKNVIANKVQQLLDIETRVTAEGIYNKFTKEIIVLFASSKNYNSLSGNTISYSMVFYDEYNQNLTTDMMVLIENFLLSMNTVFRTNKFKIVVCGNTKTQNNIFYNLYHIDPPFINNQTTVLNWEDYLLCIRYDDEVFTEYVGDTLDMEMIKKANPELYDQMFMGKNFGFEDVLILNQVTTENWTPTIKYFIYMERIYQLHEKMVETGDKYYGLFYQGKLTNMFTDEDKEVYTADLKLMNLFNFTNINDERANGFASLVVQSIGKQKIFFNDFVAYEFFTTNRWTFKSSTWQSIYK